MLLRLIFWALIFYLIYKTINKYFGPPETRDSVRDRKNKEPKIELRDSDIEDISFREIKDKKKE